VTPEIFIDNCREWKINRAAAATPHRQRLLIADDAGKPGG
jgi:hypothetical protein